MSAQSFSTLENEFLSFSRQRGKYVFESAKKVS